MISCAKDSSGNPLRNDSGAKIEAKSLTEFYEIVVVISNVLNEGAPK